jgi:ppGpp synthetase/RelA/SpoT-type nucleotidyltranferase
MGLDGEPKTSIDEVADRILAQYLKLFPRYEAATDLLGALVTQLCQIKEIQIDSVSARAKKPPNLEEKLRRKHKYSELSELPDLVGIRVVTRYAAHVPDVCSLLTTEFDVLEDVDHGVDSVESFGYASRHLICSLGESRRGLPEWTEYASIVFEVQVRSILQHAWASISHGLDYKTDGEVPSEVRRQLFRVAALLETGDELFDRFRAAVINVRQDYGKEVSLGRWESLPIDLDSLLAAREALPFDGLRELAERAGWSSRRSSYSTEEMRRWYGSLVRVSEAAELGTLGELSDFLAGYVEDVDSLRRIAASCKHNGKVPAAIGPDIASFLLLSFGPIRDVWTASAEFAAPIQRALVDLRTRGGEGETS